MPNTTRKGDPGGKLPPEAVAALLEAAQRARQSGNIPAARALLRALSAQAPDAPRVWLSLALVAETRAEQRAALERVLALDPQNVLARRGMAHLQEMAQTQPVPRAPAPGRSATAPIDARPAADYTTRRLEETEAAATVPADRGRPDLAPQAATGGRRGAPALTPLAPTAQEHARAIRWPLYAVIGISLLAVLLAALLIRPAWLFGAGGSIAGTPGIAEATASAATPAPADTASGAVAPTLPVAQATAAPTGGAATAAAPDSAATALAATEAPTAARSTEAPPTAAPPSATPSPEPTQPPGLPPGTIVRQGQWSAVLLRPDYAVMLDGSVGAFQPRGRFLLALVAVANDGAAPARIPADLFEVVDRSGNRYQPLPAASTAYLQAYGRGQRGDLSMEDPIPSDGGNKSVPLIFDIPQSARGLSLVVKGSTKGWAIQQ